ncbi:alpha/beta hydrolase [Nocardia mexicana]|uniref:Alpha/beta hydrolase family protein n=1 Tax=Nocardia mexicana TaxID=279262 RepID=A0A370GHZ8_9NOCA|nr:alpha/beta hydrolase [Nocardia mexicana]RDI42004.1 alpha/beta hydrolase family protein [Nocardia mexicana]
MVRKGRAGRGSVLLAMVALTGTLAAPASADGDTGAGLHWGACPEKVAAESPELQCATVPVPVDYAVPDGPAIDLMVSKLASRNAAERRGVLLLNPGGPGGSGLNFGSFLAAHGLPPEVTDSYDLIGMDTRGIGYSAPVSCGFTPDMAYTGNIPPYAVDDAAVTEQAAVAEDVANRCAANDREGRLRGVSTANMARDLDRIRAALGEEKASYYGASYGSALGAAYASMFPERSDRIVLDSNLADTHLDQDGIRRFGLGAEDTFPDFATWAAERDGDYHLGRTPDAVRASYFELAERLDKAPMPELDGRAFRFMTYFGLYGPSKYAATADIWRSVRDGDAEGVRRAVTGDGSAPPPAEPHTIDNSWSVFLAVTCNDVAWPRGVEPYRTAVAEDRAKYPLYGAAAANVMPCAFWPGAPAEPPVRVAAEGPNNVLLVQNLRDPVTPHRNAELLRAKFGDRARLVSVDQSGHGAYVNHDNACGKATTTDFLVNGKMPEKDTFCAAD